MNNMKTKKFKAVGRRISWSLTLVATLIFAACNNENDETKEEEETTTPVEQIVMEQTELNLTPSAGATSFDIQFTPTGAKVKTLTVASSNPQVATASGRLYNKENKTRTALSTRTAKEGYDSAEIQVTPVSNGEATITITADDATLSFTVTVKEPEPIETGEVKKVGLTKAALGLKLNFEVFPFKKEEYPNNDVLIEIICSSEKENIEEEEDKCEYYECVQKSDELKKEMELTITRLQPNTKYYYRACISSLKGMGGGTYGEIKSFTTLTEKEIITEKIVDLGLSVKWAGWNIGATKPEEIGGYYAWGETEEQADKMYSWSRYQWGDAPTKYNDTDKKIVLDAEDDVAHVKWGDDWRMPTLEEMNELKECMWTSTTFNGVKGYKVVGESGNAIFIPFSGMYANDLSGSTDDSPLWTSELSSSNSQKAMLLWKTFKSGTSILPEGDFFDIMANRCIGCCVRAVYVGK